MTCSRHDRSASPHTPAHAGERPAGQTAPAPAQSAPAWAPAAGRTKWSKQQIQQARRTPLPPILQDRGYVLQPIGDENFRLQDVPGLVVKRHYWIWNDTDAPRRDTQWRGMQGNAIDFFVQIECRSFNEAMQILAENQ